MKVAVRSGRVAMLSGWDCAWTTRAFYETAVGIKGLFVFSFIDLALRMRRS
jgi:hypothetical protein